VTLAAGDDQHATAARDDVELTQPSPIVAQQDLAARSAQKLRRQLLRALPALLACCQHVL